LWEVKLSDISRQPKVVQRFFVANCQDSIVFLALGLDYWVACYNYLRTWWEDALLTKIGLFRR
jgi:hypothetical protein